MSSLSLFNVCTFPFSIYFVSFRNPCKICFILSIFRFRAIDHGIRPIWGEFTKVSSNWTAFLERRQKNENISELKWKRRWVILLYRAPYVAIETQLDESYSRRFQLRMFSVSWNFRLHTMAKAQSCGIHLHVMFYDTANLKSLLSFVKQFLSVIVLLDGLSSNL